MSRFLPLGLMALALSSCQQPAINPAATAIVKDVRIPKSMPWYARFATHSFIDFRSDPSSPWQRIEIVNKSSGLNIDLIPQKLVYQNHRWDNPVRIVSQSTHDGRDLAAQIIAFGKSYDDSLYKPWPGPNSNTFTDQLLRKVNGLSGVLDHNGVGKDNTWHAGPTAGATGLEIQSPLLGVEAGLKEGLNLNILGFTTGIGIWPPAIKIPFLPQFPLRPTMAESPAQR